MKRSLSAERGSWTVIAASSLVVVLLGFWSVALALAQINGVRQVAAGALRIALSASARQLDLVALAQGSLVLHQRAAQNTFDALLRQNLGALTSRKVSCTPSPLRFPQASPPQIDGSLTCQVPLLLGSSFLPSVSLSLSATSGPEATP